MTPYDLMLSLGTALSALNGTVGGDGSTQDELRDARLALTRLLLDAVKQVTS